MKIKQCLENCECNYGVPFDECECSCPSWCGNSEFDHILKENPEPYKTVEVSSQ